MEDQVLTIVCKLSPTPEQVNQIDATLQAFADACSYANEIVVAKTTSRTTIQSLVYQDLRSRFGLSANLAVRVCARVGANRKTAKLKNKPVRAFKATSADYDARIFDFREKDWTVSLTLMNGRHHIKMDVGQYQVGQLTGRKPTSAQLCKHRDGRYYIHIQTKDTPPDPLKASNVIGVDFGRTDLAVTSEGQKWSGKETTSTRDRFARTRQSLQAKASKGTRSTRRRCRNILKRLSGRERRFQADQNHVISKQIIKRAVETKSIVAIEDLTGIRDRTNQQPRNKTEQRRSNSWAFYQLRQFLEYKGIKNGVEVIAVNPRYTSQMCHKCHHMHPVSGQSYRNGKAFKCGYCGWSGDADLNGAINISIIGAAVSTPRGSALSCDLSQHIVRATASSVPLGRRS
jgi:IS605 OrfB family transposase